MSSSSQRYVRAKWRAAKTARQEAREKFLAEAKAQLEQLEAKQIGLDQKSMGLKNSQGNI